MAQYFPYGPGMPPQVDGRSSQFNGGPYGIAPTPKGAKKMDKDGFKI
jgi:hypothetical protein